MSANYLKSLDYRFKIHQNYLYAINQHPLSYALMVVACFHPSCYCTPIPFMCFCTSRLFWVCQIEIEIIIRIWTKQHLLWQNTTCSPAGEMNVFSVEQAEQTQSEQTQFGCDTELWWRKEQRVALLYRGEDCADDALDLRSCRREIRGVVVLPGRGDGGGVRSCRDLGCFWLEVEDRSPAGTKWETRRGENRREERERKRGEEERDEDLRDADHD